MVTIRTLAAIGLILGLGTCVFAVEKSALKGVAQSKPSTTRKPVDRNRPVTGNPKVANDKIHSLDLPYGEQRGRARAPDFFHIHVNPATNRSKGGPEAPKGQGTSQGAAPKTIGPRIEKATSVKGAPNPAQNISESAPLIDWIQGIR